MKEEDIYEILIKKRDELFSVGDAMAVEFSLQEMNVLSDLTQLRALKMKTVFPTDYEVAKDIFDCAQKVMLEQNIYRVLEYCVWKNRLLLHNVAKVFKRLGGIEYGNRRVPYKDE